ncbi:MAG: hypothetical protein SH821_03715 [Phototrophicales bacterium]|nr:hypothetical protein [Phototrophicales bacterium]
MVWRLHLSDQSIPYLDILSGKTPLLACWIRHNYVVYYDLATGTQVGEKAILATGMEDRRGDAWQLFLANLIAPNGLYLPTIRLEGVTVFMSNDGKLRLYQSGTTDLYLENLGQEIPLVIHDDGFVAVGLDRFLGLIAALDRAGNLHLFQQHMKVGIFPTGLTPRSERRASIAISHGGSAVYVCDGEKIIRTDSSGKIHKTIESHYPIRQIVCSPNGLILLTHDFENGVIRAYEGATFTPTHQRFGIDLLVSAQPRQLLADMPPRAVTISALDVDDVGTIAFSMSGVICVTHRDQMDTIPRLQSLF